jgi:hypothetical protein
MGDGATDWASVLRLRTLARLSAEKERRDCQSLADALESGKRQLTHEERIRCMRALRYFARESQKGG